ncbi:MAG: hypothetical protein RR620_08600 [Clostridium sp.]
MKKEITYRVDGEAVDITAIVTAEWEYDYIMDNFDVRKIKTLD